MSLNLDVERPEKHSTGTGHETFVHIRPSVIYRVIYYIMAFWLTLACVARLVIMFSLAHPLDPLPFIGFGFGAIALLAAILGLDKEG